VDAKVEHLVAVVLGISSASIWASGPFVFNQSPPFQASLKGLVWNGSMSLTAGASGTRGMA
jgi:hypothetical protein